MQRFILLLIITVCWISGFAQSKIDIHQLEQDRLQLVYLGEGPTYLTPHLLRTFNNAMDFHQKLWDYDPGKVYVMLNDFQDYGNGGALSMPLNQVFIGIGSYNFAFSIIPSSERFQWLFNHELTHIVMTDKANSRDKAWRRAFFGKVRRDEKQPMSALWSYLTVPRWYAPRWYQEGIAIFMETWMSGGLGRTTGYYDEMYFRSIVLEEHPIHSVVGLETEGTATDFQVGANAYLYGSRFTTHLASEYGIDKLRDFYLRSENSKAFYSRQFKQVYGRSVEAVWEEWSDTERVFQKENLRRIREYPLTDFSPITEHPLGNVSNFRYNPDTKKIYAAINHPGIISQIAEIDIQTGSIRKLAELRNPGLYYSAHLAYDAEENRIFFTDQNSKYRSLEMVDADSGKKQTLIPFSRTGDLVFNPADRSLWGVRLNNGNATLVKIPEPYNSMEPLFEVPFGQSLFDLDISSDGRMLSASLSGISGEQEVIVFQIASLEAGDPSYRTIHKLEDNTLTQFKFSQDNQSLIGTSYYTGVSNVWKLDVEDGSFDLLSNTDTGFFMPVQYDADSLLVLRFYRDGMLPGRIPMEVLHEANAIEFMGNRVVRDHPEVVEWSLPPPPSINRTNLTERPYRPLGEMFLANAWPDIAGYKNSVAAGYRMLVRDPQGISQLNVFLGVSPWSDYQKKQQFHADLDWQYWNWKLTASWNKTDFYDLFGPTKRSRAGYAAGLSYTKTNSLRHPLRWSYSMGIYTYGDLEVLPQYQNIATPIRDFQTATASYELSRLRTTLGGIDDEKGFRWEIAGQTKYAGQDLYPAIRSEQEVGFLVPHVRNTSFWIRNSIGQSFGQGSSPLSNFYLGGFRNNYVDWRDARQYRGSLAFPGADIDAISAKSFVRTMGELNLKPLRTRNLGSTWIYPTHIYTSFFGTHLATDLDQSDLRRHLFNIGFQTDIEIVLFSYMKTTWSAGYARFIESGRDPQGKWMFSVKLLGM
ncbi:MAG: YncE family protein [Bacteroidales bacterium]